MFRFVLWNIDNPESDVRQAAVISAVDDLILEVGPEVIAFVEPPRAGSSLHGRLLEMKYDFWAAGRSRFAVFSKFSSRLAERFIPPSDPTRYEAWKLELPGRTDLHLFLVHGRDRRNHNASAREADMRRLADDVRLLERLSDHDNTIVMGDFNDGPFDKSLIRFDFLHSTNSKAIAGRGVRTLRGDQSTPFYNPSWSLLSDVHGKTPGTYFLEGPEEDEMHWNVLDQFMIRASLIPAFESGGIRVITRVGSRDLTSVSGRPIAEVSDHLPVLLELGI